MSRELFALSTDVAKSKHPEKEEVVDATTTLVLSADEKETLTFLLKRHFEGARSIGSANTELSLWEKKQLRSVLTKLHPVQRTSPSPSFRSPPSPKALGKPRVRR